MKHKLIALLILAFNCLPSFAIKRKAPETNPLPRFILRTVDNRTEDFGFVYYNQQNSQLFAGKNVLLLPIDFEPSGNDPQVEESKDIIFNFLKSENPLTENEIVAIPFRIVKQVRPSADDPNIIEITFAVALYRIDMSPTGQPNITMLRQSFSTFIIHRNDRDNYFFDVVLDGADFINSNFTIKAQTKKAAN